MEPGLPPCPQRAGPWQNVLVIPAYRESPGLLQRLAALPGGAGRSLVILVLNRPDSDPDPGANAALRLATHALPAGADAPGAHTFYPLNEHTDLYLHDIDLLAGAIPKARGVGLARKTGCDIAFKWMSQGAIAGRWICSTDADARLPQDYFPRLGGLTPAAAAVVYPFWHAPGADTTCDLATALYELRLHHYVLGLEYARSPYAFHTLGSCLAVTFPAYAQVRGFPRRAGAEDFYLLNKLAKVGPVVRLAGSCIELESRESSRVPFGTGPAVANIGAAQNPADLALFYHPACFEALRGFLEAVPHLRQAPLSSLPDLLAAGGLERSLALSCRAVLASLGLGRAIDHCRRQGGSPELFLRHFHQWFDGFRTLKFIHGLRDGGRPLQSLSQLSPEHPRLWPGGENLGIDALRDAARRHWHWTRP